MATCGKRGPAASSPMTPCSRLRYAAYFDNGTSHAIHIGQPGTLMLGLHAAHELPIINLTFTVCMAAAAAQHAGALQRSFTGAFTQICRPQMSVPS